MLEVFSSIDLADAHTIKYFLESKGIQAFIHNENINQLPGTGLRSLPMLWPAVWIADEARFREAKLLIKKFENDGGFIKSESVSLPPWLCQGCKEENDGSFEFCWNCNRNAPLACVA